MHPTVSLNLSQSVNSKGIKRVKKWAICKIHSRVGSSKGNEIRCHDLCFNVGKIYKTSQYM